MPCSLRFPIDSGRFAGLAAAGVLALSAAACVAPSSGPPAPSGVATAPATGVGNPALHRCEQINVGTAEDPRFVPDPACGSGR